MKKFSLTLTSLFFLFALSILAPTCQAQVVRTFVSSLGSDAFACTSPLLPCRNIQSAITKVQAGGEVVVLDSGNFQPFVVNKAVSIVAAPSAHPGMSVTSGAGITVSAGSNDVVSIRGLSIISQGGSRGVHFQSAKALQVENCTISGFTPLPTDCCTDGILSTTPSILVVKNTIVRNNFNGIRIFSSQSALIENSRFEENTNGLWAEEAARATISNSIVVGNGSGITSFSNPASSATAPAEITVENCRVIGNGLGINSIGKAGDNTIIWTLIRVSNTTITSNTQGLIVGTAGSGRLFSRGNNTVEGNNIDGAFTDIYVAK
jgi:nitrous oxidase accessory protein NosD